MKCDELEELYAGQFSPSARVYGALYVNEAIAELKAENERLKAIRKVHVEAIASMEAGLHQDDKEICRLKRALWLARAEIARTSAWVFWNRKDDYNYNKWKKVERKCRAKAKEYL